MKEYFEAVGFDVDFQCIIVDRPKWFEAWLFLYF